MAVRTRAIRGWRAVVALAVFAAIGLSASAPAEASGRIGLARGVTVWRVSFHNDAGKTVRGVLMHVYLGTPGVSINAGSPRQVLGATRSTVAAQADASHAIGGINGDFFDPTTSVAVPRAVLIRSSGLRKTPRLSWQANFYVDTTGRAHIGAIGFQGLVSRAAVGGRLAATRRLFSVNNVADISRGHLVLMTSQLLAPLGLPGGCTTVLGTEAGGVRTISAVVTGLGWLPRLARTWWGLVGCGDSGSWLSSSLRVGDTVSMSLGFPDGLPRAAVGGGQVLVSGGAAYADPDRPSLDPGNRNPETFACVSADGLGVLFGVLDGRSRASAGVTYAELTKYLLRLKCYSGMVLDGGGSSTMVAKLPGRGSNSVMNVPSDGRPRRVADGLYVYSN
jgi:hypothetical protein